MHLELLGAGAAFAVDVDGSPAYVVVARDEAQRRGVADRVHYEAGDFVELAPSIAPADLVALDRVVCCYPDMPALLAASAGRPVTVTVEWTVDGAVPLTVHLADRALDIGPRADTSFVSAA